MDPAACKDQSVTMEGGDPVIPEERSRTRVDGRRAGNEALHRVQSSGECRCTIIGSHGSRPPVVARRPGLDCMQGVGRSRADRRTSGLGFAADPAIPLTVIEAKLSAFSS